MTSHQSKYFIIGGSFINKNIIFYVLVVYIKIVIIMNLTFYELVYLNIPDILLWSVLFSRHPKTVTYLSMGVPDVLHT